MRRHANRQRGVQANLNLPHIHEIRIPVAPKREADELVRVVSGALALHHRLVDRGDALARNLEALDQSSLAKAFRGELVDQNPDDETADVLLVRIKAEAVAPPARKTGGRKPREVVSK